MGNNNIRVAFFTPEFCVSQNYIYQSQVLGQATALQKAGFKCLLIASEIDGERSALSMKMSRLKYLDQMHIFPIYPKRPSFFRIGMKSHAAASIALPQLEVWRPDVIYTRNLWAFGAARRMSTKLRAKLIYDCRGLVAKEAAYKGLNSIATKFLQFIENRTIFKADQILCVSEKYRQWLINNFTIENALVVPSCVSHTDFGYQEEARNRIRRDIGWYDHTPVIVYCGGLSKWQRIGDIITLMKEMKDLWSDIKFIFIVPETDKLEKLASSRGLSSDTLHCLNLKNEKIPQWLSAADAGVILRHNNLVNHVASPIKVIEYLACGLPVICSAGVGDISEIIENERVGLIVEENHRDTAQKAINMLKKSLKSSEYRERGQALVRRQFSWIAHIDTYRRAYEPVNTY